MSSAGAGSGGILVAWGDNAQGQSTPPTGLSGVVAIAAGFYHGLAVKADGTVIGWGLNNSGQITIPAGLTGVTAVAAGYGHSLALKSDGTVVAWGDNFYGQATVPEGLSGVSAIAAGAQYSLALLSDGTLVAWGDPGFGQTTVPDISGITAIAAGGDHNLALLKNGSVVAWGDNSSGESTVPPELGGPAQGTIPPSPAVATAIAAGIGHSLAVVNGGVVAWGNNASGQATVPRGLTGVKAVAAGAGFSLALKSDGTVVGWGGGSSGVPARLGSVFAIAAKYGYSEALENAPVVSDTSAPVLALPGNIKAVATSGAGAIVTYKYSARDVDDAVSASSCVPASGSLFRVGKTTVRCSATDTNGNTSNGRFTVTVSPPVPPTTSTSSPPSTTTTSTTSTTRPVVSGPTTTTSRRSLVPTSTSTTTSVASAPPAPPVAPPGIGGPVVPPAPLRPPAVRTSLIAVGPDRHGQGPAGSDLHVSGGGYSTCQTVYFWFDSARIGSAQPDARGNVAESGLSAPGDARVGSHRIASSCDAAGKTVVKVATFRVLASSAHRSAFVTSIPNPGQISTNPAVLAASAAVALAIIPLLAFPSQLFNSTLQENYEEVSGWFRRPARKPAKARKPASRATQTAEFSAFLAAGAVLYGLLTPGFGFNRTSLALGLGLGLALLVICVGFSVPTLSYMRRRYHERGRLQILPGTIVIAAVCVGASRLLHFQPGALYGLLAVFAFGRDLDAKRKGRLTAVSAVFILTVAVAAWFVRVPVAAAAGRPGAGLGLLILDAALSAVFLLGLESLVVSLLPLRFLDGSKVMAWSRLAWAGLFGLGLFAVVHVLLRPGSGYVGHTTGGSMLVVGAFYVAFGLLSVGLWAYFRFRHHPETDFSPQEGMMVGLTE
ncbi:MAG: hypothetical protein QOK39_2256 [Acidimicrobiaceae bacterium]|nr:hypothetical protein [Acidimicrobiaceae bacterium]